jgi:hypothetical protein
MSTSRHTTQGMLPHKTPKGLAMPRPFGVLLRPYMGYVTLLPADYFPLPSSADRR